MYLALTEHELKLVKEAVEYLATHPNHDRHALSALHKRLELLEGVYANG